jgi:hypothetical protein
MVYSYKVNRSIAMTVEELQTELETMISCLISSDFENINSETAAKIDTLAASAGELGMNEGKRLIKNLSATIKAIKRGKSKAESGHVRLTALEFYAKKLSSSENTEDL